MRRILACLGALVMLPIVAGCGGGQAPKPVVRPTVASVKADTGHTCLRTDLAMQCVLPSLALTRPVADLVHAHVSVRAASDGGLYGVDFAWGGPRSCAAMRALGAHFAISYFSYDFSGKNWSKALVDEFHSCGIATVGGWETSANRAEQGYAAGVSDAYAAAGQARAVGNLDRPLWFAIDFDANGPEVLSYFQGVHSVLGARTQAYGGYRPLLYLYQHGVVGHQNFQTYAWSGGAWLPASIAPLEQYLNGNTFDNDRAIAADYGQWPAPTPPGPTHGQIGSWARARAASIGAYRHHGCRSPVITTGTCGQLGWRVNHFQKLLDPTNSTKLVCFGHHAKPNAAECQIVRSAVYHWGRARASTFNAEGQNGCESARRPVRNRLCDELRQRYGYFDRRARHTVVSSRY